MASKDTKQTEKGRPPQAQKIVGTSSVNNNTNGSHHNSSYVPDDGRHVSISSDETQQGEHSDKKIKLPEGSYDRQRVSGDSGKKIILPEESYDRHRGSEDSGKKIKLPEGSYDGHRGSIASDETQHDYESNRDSKSSGGSNNSQLYQHKSKSILYKGPSEYKRNLDETRSLAFPTNENDQFKRFTYESIEDLHDVRNSWWFKVCSKCRTKETEAGWEPSYWSYVCPYPFCPTYRHVARVSALIFLGLLGWGILLTVIGEDIAPGRQLFDIAVLCILGQIGGCVFRMLNLPDLVGMMIVGVIYQNVGLIDIHGNYTQVVSLLRKISLVIILTRAGLDLDPKALTRLFCTVLRMGIYPWMCECVVLMTLAHFFLDFPWLWGLLMGSIVAAVAPAVIVPCLFRLRSKGYGVAKGIPTLVIAVAGIDDAASVAAFGIIHAIIFAENSLVFNLIMGPISLLVGIGYGFFWWFMAKYVPEQDDPFVVPLRILLMLASGLIAVLGSEAIGMAGAGPLGCISAAFMSIWVWSKQDWDVDDNPVATAYEIFWMIFEPVLFSLTGTQIKIKEIDPQLFGIGAAIIMTATAIRIGATLLAGYKAPLNTKEKLFVAIAWMAKASVQAALGPVAFDSLRNQKDKPEYHYAEVLLMICIISIVLTAPLGAMTVTLAGTKLLKKTSSVALPEGWRSTHRPSLREMQVVTDDEDDEDDDKGRRKSISSILSN